MSKLLQKKDTIDKNQNLYLHMESEMSALFVVLNVKSGDDQVNSPSANHEGLYQILHQSVLKLCNSNKSTCEAARLQPDPTGKEISERRQHGSADRWHASNKEASSAKHTLLYGRRVEEFFKKHTFAHSWDHSVSGAGAPTCRF